MEPTTFALFAQHMNREVIVWDGHPFTPGAAVAMFAMLIPIVIVPTAMIIRSSQKKREMEHRERMKALEFGRTLPGDESEWSPMRVATKIGAGVPLGLMGIAWLTSMTVRDRDVIQAAWVGGGAISFIAVICGAILALRAFGLDHRLRLAQDEAARKPTFDPDAYDHVGTRG
ncbi:hypothetical protein TA3x_001870 [Tundrisphaera sp. TA3]|uniref:hypothetical protein n=1 Tax=Tundrisphaera sp. TA3 TaxID=3435775 RepID=UPI003EBFA8EA